jgi:hypothetical protein
MSGQGAVFLFANAGGPNRTCPKVEAETPSLKRTQLVQSLPVFRQDSHDA